MLQKMISGFFLILVLLWGCNSSDNSAQNKPQNKAAAGNSEIEVSYKAPKQWIAETPQSSMRKAQYKLPGQNGAEAAELAVFYFPGEGGSVEANLERWYGQFQQPDGSETSQHVQKQSLTVHGVEVTEVYVTGTYLKTSSPMMSGPMEEMTGYAMLAAIAETSNGPWFFKATGPQKTIDYWRPDFDKFVHTFRLAGS
jgi:hypothetical protein